jgi:DNA-binding MarR family transcriptional regulator
MDVTGEPRWLDDDQQQSWRALMMGMTLLLERLDEDLRREFSMSLTEYEVLVRLSERPGRAMRMAQLADAMAHSRSRVTHTVARMEAVGYVTRGTTPEDGRGVVATMTEKGYDLLVKAAPCHVESVRRNVVDLVDEADFAAVGRVFDRVADHLVNRHPESELRAQ